MDIFVAGVGITPFRLDLNRSIKTMVKSATSFCLTDSNHASTDDVEAVFYANTAQGVLEGQVACGGQIALRASGFQGIPVVNVENACASGSTAFYLAANHLRAGLADVVMAVGAEKLSTPNSALLGKVFEGGVDVNDMSGVIARLEKFSAGIKAPAVEGHRSMFMDIYGHWTRAHMRDFGTTQHHLAEIASKNHFHSTMNPICQFQKEFSVDEVLNGRALSYPLTVPMCSPFSDGAAAVMLCTEAGLKKLGFTGDKIKVEACVLRSGIDRDDTDWSRHVAKLTADDAYQQAGLSPQDMSIAEVHDATAFGELLNIENLGFCPRGEGGAFSASGATRLGGQLPVNVSGGLESRGHPVGASGLAQIFELVTQLRNQSGKRQVNGANLAIAENGGALYGIEEACAVVSILGRQN